MQIQSNRNRGMITIVLVVAIFLLILLLIWLLMRGRIKPDPHLHATITRIDVKSATDRPLRATVDRLRQYISNSTSLKIGELLALSQSAELLKAGEDAIAAFYAEQNGSNSPSLKSRPVALEPELHSEDRRELSIKSETVDGKQLGSTKSQKGKYVELTFLVDEVSNWKPPHFDSRGSRLPPDQTVASCKKYKNRVADVKNQDFGAFFGIDSGVRFQPVQKDLRTDGLDIILKKLYLVHLLEASRIREEDINGEIAPDVTLAMVPLKEQTDAIKGMDAVRTHDYAEGYGVWIDLLIHDRMYNVERGANPFAANGEAHEIWQKLRVANFDGLGFSFGPRTLRFDGSVASIALFALLNLERSKASNSELKALFDSDSHNIMRKITNWIEARYIAIGFKIESDARPSFVYYGEVGHHLVGGKLNYFLCKAVIAGDKVEQTFYLERFKQVAGVLRGSPSAKKADWNGVTTYYDYCYVMRALTLASRYEYELFDNNKPQAQQYLEWAEELLKTRGGDKGDAFDQANHADVSRYYRLLGNSAFAHEALKLHQALQLKDSDK
jgi:hypothetical protein